jgi:hypothetical protein
MSVPKSVVEDSPLLDIDDAFKGPWHNPDNMKRWLFDSAGTSGPRLHFQMWYTPPHASCIVDPAPPTSYVAYIYNPVLL